MPAGRRVSSLEERKKIDRNRVKAANKKKKSDLDDFIVPEGELEDSEEEEVNELEAKKERKRKRNMFIVSS